MTTENSILTNQARISLGGKWGIAILACLLYLILTGIPQSMEHTGTLLSLLISGPFALGMAMFVLNVSRGNKISVGQVFNGFQNYGKAVLASLIMGIFIILWTLLLIVPGIIAALSYSMTYFILADNPKIKAMEAIDRSSAMMDGYKMKLFKLCLHFLLLFLLCILTLGIGLLWFFPYVYVTTAKFYDDIK